MNTANLQLEGVYVAVAALMEALRSKGLLSEQEIEQALSAAESRIAADPGRPNELSGAHLDAIRFPLRFLKLANGHAAKGDQFSFMRLAAEVGRTKPDHETGTRQDRPSRS
jgi:hypothetical protein